MKAPESTLAALADRLRKRATQDRSYAVNNAIVADLLQPQMDAFEARDGHNVYAVRMQIDHRNSAKRDNAWADDLEAAASILERQQADLEDLREALAAIEKAIMRGDDAEAMGVIGEIANRAHTGGQP